MRYVVCVVFALLVSACGGGSDFDREAVRNQLDTIDAATLDDAAALCDDTGDAQYEWALLGMHDEMNVTQLAAQAVGCADRYRPIAESNGWPITP